MKPIRNTIIGLATTASVIGTVDASVLNTTPVERIEIVANERIEARQIGDIVETKLPWKGEQGIVVTYDMGKPSVAEKLADKRDKEVIVDTVNFGDGGFKVDILLNKKPKDNVFCYTIQGAENYDFFYQPALTEEEIDRGAHRPQEIVGSYAVYHKTLKNHIKGQQNYATGKVMHIPRPQVWEVNDKANTTEWADLSYDEAKSELCVTVSSSFLAKANYPVRVDPTFGYTTIGASDQSSSASIDSFGILESSFSGTITSMTAALKITSGSGSFSTPWYISDTPSAFGNIYNASENMSYTTSYAWKTHDVSPDEVVSSTDTYISMSPYYPGPFGAKGQIAYDTSSGTSHGHFDSTVSWVEDPTVLYSLYATYTATASTPSPVFVPHSVY